MKDVLVVDDSRIALRFLQRRLQRLGYRVQAVQTAQQALALLDSQPFVLVFLDIGLDASGPDGLALCRHITQRRSPLGSRAPAVVMVTGSASATDRVRGDLAGCDAYLTKPLMDDALAATLARLDPSGTSGAA